MEDLRNDILELKKMFEVFKEAKVESLIEKIEITEKNDVLLLKKEIQMYKYFIACLNNVINNNTPS